MEELDLILGGSGTVDVKSLSPLVLAYVGDAVYEMMARLYTLSSGNQPVNKLNRKTRAVVNAKAQAEMYFRIRPLLTEEEDTVFHRGRNANSHTSAKNADIIDYRHATGLEAVFGYLYLSGQKERAVELFRAGWQA